MSIKRQTSPLRLHMGCGETLNPRVPVVKASQPAATERRVMRTQTKTVKDKR